MSVQNSAAPSGYASLASSAIGALVIFVALIGIAAVLDAPRSLTDVAIDSESIRFAEPPNFEQQPAREFHAVAPATGRYEEPALQVNYEVHA